MIRLMVHGGAGARNFSPEAWGHNRAQYKEAMETALLEGGQILKQGGAALDAVEAAVQVLEDSPFYNAGRGAVLDRAGRYSLDAAIMNGNGQSGSVAAVHEVKNPIRLARVLAAEPSLAFLAGRGAVEYAKQKGLPLEADQYFITPHRSAQFEELRGSTEVSLDHIANDVHGTVGAVALDDSGNLAAATSTGGLVNKAEGRVGDTPILGAGTYAENGVCAVSCTGHGEAFMRAVSSYDIAARMKYGGSKLSEATEQMLEGRVRSFGGEGGVIAIGADGTLVARFSTGGMFFGTFDGQQRAYLIDESESVG